MGGRLYVEELIASAGLVVPKTAGAGIKLEPGAETYGWADIIGPIRPKSTGAGKPTLGTLRNVWQSYYFAAGDTYNCDFHMPHDWAPGTDLYIHLHWSHNGTAISGNLVIDWWATYAKRATGVFPAEINQQQTIAAPNIATIPRWSHQVHEIQLSTPGGSATRLDTDDLEVDGLIGVQLVATTIPTITGGTPNNPFILFADIHYQTTGIMGTKSNAPPFYS